MPRHLHREITPHRAQRGFGLGLQSGLRDHLVLIVIIVVLALVAWPAWMDLRAREQVTEAMPMAAPAKAAVETAFSAGPTDMSQIPGWTAPPANEHLQSIAIRKDGTIVLRFAESLAPAEENELHIVPMHDGKPLDLSQNSSKGRQIKWQCGAPANGTALPEARRPMECR